MIYDIINLKGVKVKIVSKILITALIFQPLIKKKVNKKLQALDFNQNVLFEFI